MSRHDDQRLADILAAATAIDDHLHRGALDEAVRAIDPALLAREPDIPWIDVAGMRNHLAHRYFDTAHSIVQATVTHDLPPLVAAAKRLRDHLGSDG